MFFSILEISFWKVYATVKPMLLPSALKENVNNWQGLLILYTIYIIYNDAERRVNDSSHAFFRELECYGIIMSAKMGQYRRQHNKITDSALYEQTFIRSNKNPPSTFT